MMKSNTGKTPSLMDNPSANLLITMVFFASAFTSSKVVVGHMPHDAAAALRFLGGGIILAIVLAISKDHFVISPHNFMRCAISGSIGVFGVVCGRGRNPTLRLWPAIFSGEIDVFPSERRNMGQEIGR